MRVCECVCVREGERERERHRNFFVRESQTLIIIYDGENGQQNSRKRSFK